MSGRLKRAWMQDVANVFVLCVCQAALPGYKNMLTQAHILIACDYGNMSDVLM